MFVHKDVKFLRKIHHMLRSVTLSLAFRRFWKGCTVCMRNRRSGGRMVVGQWFTVNRDDHSLQDLAYLLIISNIFFIEGVLTSG